MADVLTASAVTTITFRVSHTPIAGLVDRVIEVQRLTGEHETTAEMAAAIKLIGQQCLPDPLVGVPGFHANQWMGQRLRVLG